MTEVIESVAVIMGPTEENEKCEYCGKDKHDFAEDSGSNLGNSGQLSRNIIKDNKKHKWYTGGFSIAAHHLICSESMDDDDWPIYADQFGYNINHKNNGIMLPMKMKNACQLHVPLHRSNHDKGMAGGVAYPDKIKTEMDKYKKDIKSGKYCGNPRGLVDDLDEYSEFVLGEVNSFNWTLTKDGKDYKPGGIGCAGVNSLRDKPTNPCPDDRKHGITKKNGSTPIPRNTASLKIGT